jgi:hypothetical protein
VQYAVRPDGAAGQRHPIDAAGRIGDVAFAAFDSWMKTRSSSDVVLGSVEICA